MNWFLRHLVLCLLRLRYGIRVRGLRQVAQRGCRGILFLPNHPALIDPVIMMAVLSKDFHAGALADADQVDRFFIRSLSRRAGVLTIPSVSRYGMEGGRAIAEALRAIVEALRQGRNVLLYPAGRIYRQKLEDLGGNSAVEAILRRLPEVRVVLVRTRGLWGSRFSWATGTAPHVGKTLKRGLWQLLASLVLFVPRRNVDIALVEPDDLPRQADRHTINRYLERFYNQEAPPNTYVPYTVWQGRRPKVLPEPAGTGASAERLAQVPPGTRQIVTQRLREFSGVRSLHDTDLLGSDLGLDSLARAELLAWLQSEFGFPQGNADSLQSVSDVMLAACGEALAANETIIKPAPRKWFRGLEGVTGRLNIPEGANIAEVFLRQARLHPGRVVLADQAAGARTYRDIVTACLLLKPILAELPGQYLGIMLPASVVAAVVYMAALFAGKTPVLVNWTTGPRNVVHGLDVLGVRHVVTARAVLRGVQGGGVDLSGIEDRFVYVEEVLKNLPLIWKLAAATVARTPWWGSLDKAKVSATAAVLFTSGSESLPKAVPLTHTNILSNLRDVTDFVAINQGDRLIGMLPPFHSLGLTVTLVLPLVSGVRAVYHPNPTEGALLAGVIEAYSASLAVGTPTFLGGIARAAKPGQLSSLRLAVTGAEKCPPRVYEAISRQCPQAVILEGYGVTECSPIVSVNDATCPRPQTIGKVLPSFEHAIVDPQTLKRVGVGQAGMLLVRGPSVFGGYLGTGVSSPFIQFEGKDWYRTGDLVIEDGKRVLTFAGRLNRFVKLGGEMISLPAIEAVLERHYPPAEVPGKVPAPAIAVEALGEAEHAEIVLFTALDLQREEVNALLKQAGLSPLHNIRRVIHVDSIPLLGTGKTDYGTLRETPA